MSYQLNTIPIDAILSIYNNGLDDGDLFCLLVTSKSMLSYIYNTDFSSYLFKMNTCFLTNKKILKLFHFFSKFDKMDFMKEVLSNPETASLTHRVFISTFINQRRYSIDHRSYKESGIYEILESYTDITPYLSVEYKYGNDWISRKSRAESFLDLSYSFPHNKGYFNFKIGEQPRDIPYTILDECKRSEILDFFRYLIKKGAIPSLKVIKRVLISGEDEDYVLSLCRRFQIDISSILHLFKSKFDNELTVERYGLSLETLKYIITYKMNYILDSKIKLKACVFDFVKSIIGNRSYDTDTCPIHKNCPTFRFPDMTCEDKIYLIEKVVSFALLDTEVDCKNFEKLASYFLRRKIFPAIYQLINAGFIFSKIPCDLTYLQFNFLRERIGYEEKEKFDINQYIIENSLETLKENIRFLRVKIDRRGQLSWNWNYSDEKIFFISSIIERDCSRSNLLNKIEERCFVKDYDFIAKLLEVSDLSNGAKRIILRNFPELLESLEEDLIEKFYLNGAIPFIGRYETIDDNNFKYFQMYLEKSVSFNLKELENYFKYRYLSHENLSFILSKRNVKHVGRQYLNIAIYIKDYDLVNKVLIAKMVTPNINSFFFADDRILEILIEHGHTEHLIGHT